MQDWRKDRSRGIEFEDRRHLSSRSYFGICEIYGKVKQSYYSIGNNIFIVIEIR